METSKISPNVMNLAMPRGRLSFAPFADDGSKGEEIDLGNVTTMELTNGMEYKEHYTSHDDIVTLDAKKIATAKWTLKFTPDELSAENMALFLLGDVDENRPTGAYTQAGEFDKECNVASVVCDRWIDLGAKYVKPGTACVVIGGEASATLNATTSGTYPKNDSDGGYRIDFENGLIMILSDNDFSITDGDALTFTFTSGTVALKKLTNRIRPLQGYLRYRGVSEVGPRHLVEIWKVQIMPDAALGLIKPQDYANLSFTGDVFIDDDTGSHRSTDPFFRYVELDGSDVTYPVS